MLQEKQMELIHEQGVISYLKQMGVEEEDKKSEFSQAAGSYSDYEGAVRIANSACSCAENNKEKSFLFKKCSFMDKSFKDVLENLDLEKEDSDDDSSSGITKKDFDSKRSKKGKKGKKKNGTGFK